jgi:lysophospholipase L1-like esterase
MRARTVRALLARLALAGGGLVAGLALLELGLRALALVAPHALSRARPMTRDGGPYVLCVGDSHTYGSMVAPDAAYPEQLERRLRAHGVPATVYNLGLPGQSTRQTLERLPEQLAVYRPDLVLVWAGINNYWNLKGREGDPDGPRRHLGLDDLRLYRFVRLWRDGRDAGGAFAQRRPDARVVEGGFVNVRRWRLAGPGGVELLDMPIVPGNLDPIAVETVTREDLAGIVRLARSRGTPVALFTYPFPFNENVQAVNRAVRTVASDEAVPVVETDEVAATLSHHTPDELAFADTHPKPLVYAAIAHDAARRLARAHLVRRPPRRTP